MIWIKALLGVDDRRHMLRLRRSHHQPLLHQSLQQHPVWNGGKNGAQRGALVVRSDVKRDAPVVWSDVRRDAPLARSDVKRGEPLANSDVRHGADCTCSPTSPQNNNSNHHQQRIAHRAQNSVGLLFLTMQKLRQLGDVRRDPSRLG